MCVWVCASEQCDKKLQVYAVDMENLASVRSFCGQVYVWTYVCMCVCLYVSMHAP